jgi:hypothetical protein
MSGREPTSASFDPERLTPRRRRIDPIVVAVPVVIAGIVVAILKPWVGPTEAPSPPTVAEASPVAPAPDVPRRVTAEPLVRWPEVVAVTTAHDAWGARAIVRPWREGQDPSAASAPDLEELWAPAEPTVTGWSKVALPRTDKTVVALGITHPSDELPLDARIWELGRDGAWQWLDAQRLDPSPWGGALHFTPPVRDGVQQPVWLGGIYRVEILVEGGIRRIDIDVREVASVLVEPGYGAGPPPARGAFSVDVSSIPEGPFLSVDGDAMPFTASPADPATSAADVWLGAVPGGVTVLREPRASGLGLMLPPDATHVEASVRSLGPESLADTPTQIVRTRVDDGPRAPYVVFGAPGGGAWPAGTYAIDASWTSVGRGQAVTYLLELVPPEVEDPLALLAARSLAHVRSDEVAPTGVAVLAASLQCDGASPMPGLEPAFLGIEHAPDHAPDSIALERVARSGDTTDQPILVAGEVAPGLSLVGPADRAAFQPGVYRLVVGDGGDAVRTRLCVGVESVAR